MSNNFFAPDDYTTDLYATLQALAPEAGRASVGALAELLVALLNDQTTLETAELCIGRDASIARLASALAGQTISLQSGVLSFGAGSQTGDISIRDIVGRDLIQIYTVGPELVQVFADQLLESLSGRAARRFREGERKTALQTALAAGLCAALRQLDAEGCAEPSWRDALISFVTGEGAADHLAEWLLAPRIDVEPDYTQLVTDLVAATSPTQPLPTNMARELIVALGHGFFRTAAKEEALHDLLEIELLHRLAEQNQAQLKVSQRIATAGEQTATHTQHLVLLVQQSIQGQRDIYQAIESLRTYISTEPGRDFDLYQSIAAGLGEVGAAVTADARGDVQIATEMIEEGISSQHLTLFRELLVSLRGMLLNAGSAISSAELAKRAQRYRELIIAQFAYLRLEGLTTGVRPVQLPLERVYVQLRAVAEVPETADEFSPDEKRLLRLLDESPDQTGEQDSTLRELRHHLDAVRRERWTRDRLERFPIGQTLRDPSRYGLVLLGDPGSGKTTLLQYLALIFARGTATVKEQLKLEEAEADRLPIFAPLATYDEFLGEQPELTIEEFLPHYYDRRRAAPGLGPVFTTALAAGRALVLLDGLDEVVDEGRRKFVAEQASVFVRSAMQRGNRVLVTSRIYGYRSAPLTVNLPHVTVLDFRKEEIEVFARQWCRAFAEWDAQGIITPQTLLLAQEQERDLLRDLRSNEGVERLAVNPLLLTMLALLRRQVGRLPQRRVELYDLYISTLLQSWEENRSRGARLGPPTRIDVQEARNALIPLALWLQQHRGSGTAQREDLLGQLTRFYLVDEGLEPDGLGVTPRQRREAEKRAQHFLTDMRQFSGLIVERGQNAFGFRHLTLQEYFAARALARMPAEARWQLIRPHLHSNRWREPILLCAARLGVSESRADEASALVERILGAGSEHEDILQRDLFLATDCSVDDINIGLPLLRHIVARLDPLLGSAIPRIFGGAVKRLYELSQLRIRATAQLRLPEALEALARPFHPEQAVAFFDLRPSFEEIVGIDSDEIITHLVQNW